MGDRLFENIYGLNNPNNIANMLNRLENNTLGPSSWYFHYNNYKNNRLCIMKFVISNDNQLNIYFDPRGQKSYDSAPSLRIERDKLFDFYNFFVNEIRDYIYSDEMSPKYNCRCIKIDLNNDIHRRAIANYLRTKIQTFNMPDYRHQDDIKEQINSIIHEGLQRDYSWKVYYYGKEKCLLTFVMMGYNNAFVKFTGPNSSLKTFFNYFELSKGGLSTKSINCLHYIGEKRVLENKLPNILDKGVVVDFGQYTRYDAFITEFEIQHCSQDMVPKYVDNASEQSSRPQHRLRSQLNRDAASRQFGTSQPKSMRFSHTYDNNDTNRLARRQRGVEAQLNCYVIPKSLPNPQLKSYIQISQERAFARRGMNGQSTRQQCRLETPIDLEVIDASQLRFAQFGQTEIHVRVNTGEQPTRRQPQPDISSDRDTTPDPQTIGFEMIFANEQFDEQQPRAKEGLDDFDLFDISGLHFAQLSSAGDVSQDEDQPEKLLSYEVIPEPKPTHAFQPKTIRSNQKETLASADSSKQLTNQEGTSAQTGISKQLKRQEVRPSTQHINESLRVSQLKTIYFTQRAKSDYCGYPYEALSEYRPQLDRKSMFMPTSPQRLSPRISPLNNLRKSPSSAIDSLAYDAIMRLEEQSESVKPRTGKIFESARGGYRKMEEDGTLANVTDPQHNKISDKVDKPKPKVVNFVDSQHNETEQRLTVQNEEQSQSDVQVGIATFQPLSRFRISEGVDPKKSQQQSVCREDKDNGKLHEIEGLRSENLALTSRNLTLESENNALRQQLQEVKASQKAQSGALFDMQIKLLEGTSPQGLETKTLGIKTEHLGKEVKYYQKLQLYIEKLTKYKERDSWLEKQFKIQQGEAKKIKEQDQDKESKEGLNELLEATPPMPRSRSTIDAETNGTNSTSPASKSVSENKVKKPQKPTRKGQKGSKVDGEQRNGQKEEKRPGSFTEMVECNSNHHDTDKDTLTMNQ